MARIRTIKPEFQQSENISRVSRDARLTFILLWPQCDDEGRLRANPRLLASLLFPYDDDAPKHIEKWLTELEQVGCIRRYQVDGNSYIDVPNFLEHQYIEKKKPSNIPPFPSASPPCPLPVGPGMEWNGMEGKDIGQTENDEGEKLTKDWEADFEKFWAAYPKKVAKGAARRAFKAACPKKVAIDPLILAAERYSDSRRGQDANFTKHPATWLNSEGWLDEDLQPKPVEAPTDPERNLWLARINGFRERKFWNPMTWGPPPNEPGFRGPKDLTI